MQVFAVPVDDVEILAPATSRAEGDFSPIRRPGRSLVAAGVLDDREIDLAGRVDQPDIELSPHPGLVGDPAAIGRPCGRGVIGAGKGETPEISAITIYQVELGGAASIRNEDDLPTVRRPGWRDVDGRGPDNDSPGCAGPSRSSPELRPPSTRLGVCRLLHLRYGIRPSVDAFHTPEHPNVGSIQVPDANKTSPSAEIPHAVLPNLPPGKLSRPWKLAWPNADGPNSSPPTPDANTAA